MLKKIFGFVFLGALVFSMSGCGAILGTALSAAAAYGVYQATRK